MSKVFVLDTNKQPLDPVHTGYARLLLKRGKAAVWRRFPFTIILKYAVPAPRIEPLRVKLDPGSRTTGIAVLNETTGEVVFAAELSHRGHKISEALKKRRARRRSRRQRHTRYRKPRFNNRRNKGKDWLPPSLESRISNILTWVRRLTRLCPITACSLELVKFDMQCMEHPGSSISRGHSTVMKSASTCWRSGGGNVPTAGRKRYRSKSSTSAHAPEAAPTGSAT
jgi:hypothetical protein